MMDQFEANEREDAACEKSDRIAQLELFLSMREQAARLRAVMGRELSR